MKQEAGCKKQEGPLTPFPLPRGERVWVRGVHASCFMLLASLFLCLSASLLLCTCGSQTTTGEDYGELMESPEGLALTADEHKYGWGKSDCSICHSLNNIHVSESEEGFDMEAVRAQVEDEGVASCATCHGTNGVE